MVLENVPFMLSLNRGAAIRHVVGALEELGYAWAYRTVDTRAFGLPQRRERVFLIASREEHPARLMFSSDAGERWPTDHAGRACGFYWTEGLRGLGWAVDAVPTLKGGSTLGIPSPPAYWSPSGEFFTPDLRDCERLQGFTADWTLPLETAGGRASLRWKLVGNAVSVPVAAWVGSLLGGSGAWPVASGTLPLDAGWPPAGYGDKRGRYRVDVSKWPVSVGASSLVDFLRFAPRPLSLKAASGFWSRLQRSSLRYPREFARDLQAHISTFSDGRRA